MGASFIRALRMMYLDVFLKDYSRQIYKNFSLLRAVLLSYLCLADNGRRITTRADRPVRSPFGLWHRITILNAPFVSFV